jgi:hypothetical protein
VRKPRLRRDIRSHSLKLTKAAIVHGLVFASALTTLLVAHVNTAVIDIPSDHGTIQEGIDHASDGDTILVRPGIYVENINFRGHNVVLASSSLTTGDTAYVSKTIIDGDRSGAVITFESGEDSTAAVIGFTIRNGQSRNGGGIYCSRSSPTIIGNVITGNSAKGGYHDGGGGIFCLGSRPIIRDNAINNNSASPNGGGIYCSESSDAVIVGNFISANSVYGGAGTGARGGGIGCNKSSPRIAYNKIIGNSSSFYGAGIACWYDSNCIIVNNIIYRNTAKLNGGGIHCNSNSSPVICSNVFTENRASDRGGAVCCHWDSGPTITNSILWADSAANGPEIHFHNRAPMVTYCDVQGGWKGEGNTDVDPLFRNPQRRDFHLQGSESGGDSLYSPCIDAGHPDSLDQLLDCLHGLGTERSDLGAYAGRNSGWPTCKRDDSGSSSAVGR